MTHVSPGITYSLAIQLDVDITKGRKTGKHGEKTQSTGEINNSNHISSKFGNQHRTILRRSSKLT